MRVLVAPSTEDPRDGGRVDTLAGELVVPGITCDAGEDGACECRTRFTGVGSGRSTTLATTADVDMSVKDYTAALAEHLEPADIQIWLFVAKDITPGALIGRDEDGIYDYPGVLE